jgi:hypothetical protein
MRSRILVPIAVVLAAAACERSPSSPTTVTTIVTLPTAPTTVPTTSAPTPTPSCPTCPTTCTPTATAPCPGTTTPTPGARTPEVLSFGADTARVAHGAATVLRWEVSDPAALVRIDPGIGSVGTVGFVVVWPDKTTTYTLTARNAIGTVQRQFTILVFAAAD